MTAVAFRTVEAEKYGLSALFQVVGFRNLGADVFTYSGRVYVVRLRVISDLLGELPAAHATQILYSMRAWDNAGDQFVFWTTGFPLLTPAETETTPNRVGALTQKVIMAYFTKFDYGHYVYTQPKALTESFATGIVEIAVAEDTTLGGEFAFTVEANDAVDYQVLTGGVKFVAVNKAGTITTSLAVVGSHETLATAGTISVTPTLASGADIVTLKLNAVSSLTQTTLQARWRIDWDGEAGSVTPL